MQALGKAFSAEPNGSGREMCMDGDFQLGTHTFGMYQFDRVELIENLDAICMQIFG